MHWRLPMKREASLKRRIAHAFILLAVILAGFFCIVSYTAIEVIESQVIDGRMEKLADALIAHYLKNEPYEAPPDVSFFVNKAIPLALEDKKPGVNELLLNQREVQALIRTENGNRYAVVQEMTEFEETEFIIFSSLAVGFLSSLLLAVILGLATARRIVAPITALAEAVAAKSQPSTLPSVEAEDEIGVLARAFARRTEDLQQYLRREQLFTGDVSHELRTPLTIMLGAAEVLKLQLADRPAQQAVAERLRRAAAETSERVGALLHLSRAPEQLRNCCVSMNQLIRTELERYQPLAQGKPVISRFEAQADISAELRPELASMAIGNLLRNAFQHTEHGEILVRLEQGRIIIADTGPGLPHSVRERLFERFVTEPSDSTEGTGLGLSIVKRVVDHLGWEIRLECPETGGSRFVLNFPMLASGNPRTAEDRSVNLAHEKSAIKI